MGIPVISQIGIPPSQLLQQGLTLLNDYVTIMHQDPASALVSCTTGKPSGSAMTLSSHCCTTFSNTACNFCACSWRGGKTLGGLVPPLLKLGLLMASWASAYSID